MRERIEARIKQLEQEKADLKIGAMLRDKELDGQIQALIDVLMAIDNERKTPIPQHLDHGEPNYDASCDEFVCGCGARYGGMYPKQQWREKELTHVGS